MHDAKHEIIQALQKELLVLQGLKSLSSEIGLNLGFRALENAFPNGSFPRSAVHEFISATNEDAAATSGFVACVLGKIMQKAGACIWISLSRTLFPAALTAFGIEPHKIIFIDLKKETDALWVMEEALKCDQFAAVIGEIKNISLTASRRLQLAVEQSKVTGFLLRHQPINLNPIAAVSRWRITSLPSIAEDGMPGVGFPRWNVDLLKIRNGKPGTWQIEWSSGRFNPVYKQDILLEQDQLLKAG